MKNILVPTDFSKNSIDALHYARAILEKTGGRLIIVTAYEKPYSSTTAIRSLRDRLKKAAEKKMDKLKDQLRKEESSVQFETFIREDNAVNLILNAADHFDVDMIVMGTQGSSGLEELVMGTVTSSVIAKANRPVLAVPKKAFFFGFKRITFATDLQPGSEVAAQRLLDLTAPFNSVVDLLHIFSPGSEGPGEAMEALDTKLEKSGREVHNFLLANDDLREGLFEHMEKHPSEALVMLTRKRTLLGKLFDPSLTKKVATHAETPILALHEQ